MTKDEKIARQLIRHLRGGEAFMPIDELIGRLPFEQLGTVPEGLPYSLWQQFHHLYLAQKDILEFSRDPLYVSPEWPSGYWPDEPAPESEQEWQNAVLDYHRDREALETLILNDRDLTEPFPHANGPTLLREVLLVIEHTAYHTGEMLVLARLLRLV